MKRTKTKINEKCEMFYEDRQTLSLLLWNRSKNSGCQNNRRRFITKNVEDITATLWLDLVVIDSWQAAAAGAAKTIFKLQ